MKSAAHLGETFKRTCMKLEARHTSGMPSQHCSAVMHMGSECLQSPACCNESLVPSRCIPCAQVASMLSWQPACASVDLAAAIQAHADSIPQAGSVSARMLQACGAHELATRALLDAGRVGSGPECLFSMSVVYLLHTGCCGLVAPASAVIQWLLASAHSLQICYLDLPGVCSGSGAGCRLLKQHGMHSSMHSQRWSHRSSSWLLKDQVSSCTACTVAAHVCKRLALDCETAGLFA